ncbi:hypothetical protein SAMN02745126_04017 [Enhydrobacter aerosaccus]|uniref:DUF4189 domain-containing protein n=1 Tax=Enhydrobacter aerosaccus TaxID=225324 RepID=A0A1T4RPS0_9HYPH|nr:hypothetical protein SAMN02745126_04017 [Enhydrobacter aerosaccus]
MKWVLIVVAWVSTGSVGGGYHVTGVPEFTSQQACEAARQVVLKGSSAASQFTPQVTCVQQ